ncbi:hypothetical protein [Streptomyces sp. V3I7]|uniref:hypothetical protein n=1 Tax=Streptomyces sp. V3I7 TaxID=3042278 RepID=UPI00278AB592|nr:hypothetical protein [Streptomyces sp. V3I7]MDQ0991972.1 hypothetical protein [Streptomyces sp. V3I7]
MPLLAPARRLLPVSAGALAVLLAVSGCLSREPVRAGQEGVDASAAARRSSGALTDAQARDALIGQADLGAPWKPTEGTAGWRDGLLKATTQNAECQRLMDGLYADELLGEPTKTYAVTALDDADDQAQLRYQVATRRAADVDRTLAWLKKLPQTCAQFTANTVAQGTQYVQVAPIALPAYGDARQGLRITVTGTSSSEDTAPTTLTLDVAAVRAGDDAIVLTNGALGTLPADATRQALERGTRRLAEVRERGRVQA